MKRFCIVSSKKGRGCVSIRGCGRQINKEFGLRDLKEENEGKKKWVRTDVETLISIIERWMKIS
jgi:hypothetical protein